MKKPNTFGITAKMVFIGESVDDNGWRYRQWLIRLTRLGNFHSFAYRTDADVEGDPTMTDALRTAQAKSHQERMSVLLGADFDAFLKERYQ